MEWQKFVVVLYRWYECDEDMRAMTQSSQKLGSKRIFREKTKKTHFINFSKRFVPVAHAMRALLGIA